MGIVASIEFMTLAIDFYFFLNIELIVPNHLNVNLYEKAYVQFIPKPRKFGGK